VPEAAHGSFILTSPRIPCTQVSRLESASGRMRQRLKICQVVNYMAITSVNRLLTVVARCEPRA